MLSLGSASFPVTGDRITRSSGSQGVPLVALAVGSGGSSSRVVISFSSLGTVFSTCQACQEEDYDPMLNFVSSFENFVFPDLQAGDYLDLA